MMARAPQRDDDEIDLFELVKFFVDIRRYWLIGGVGVGALALIYVLVLNPTSTLRQQTINDIGLTQERLVMIRTMLPPMVSPLKEVMVVAGLGDLYTQVTEGEDFLTEAIVGLSGVDSRDKNLKEATKGKVNTVLVALEGVDTEELKLGVTFLQNSVRSVSQYLAIKVWMDNASREAKLTLFNTEGQVNAQRLNLERSQRQLAAYQDLKPEATDVQDLQIILNLSNGSEQKADTANMRFASEFGGARYLPLENRILALKSELADLREAIFISALQVRALKTKQHGLHQLATIFNNLSYQAGVVDITPFINQVTALRNPSQSREEVAALDSLERELLGFEMQGEKFSVRLPAVTVVKKWSGKFVVIAGIIGSFMGLFVGMGVQLRRRYRQRFGA